MSLRYAQVERNLGEIDRARAIYAHCAEICDPRVRSVRHIALLANVPQDASTNLIIARQWHNVIV